MLCKIFRQRALFRVWHANFGKECSQSIRCKSNDLSSSREESSYDVIVSGGGMVGTSIAASLGHEPAFRDKKILLLDESSEQKLLELPKEFNSRVCALSLGTRNFLSGFGAFDGIESRRCHSVKRMQIWDSCSESMIVFDHDSMNKDLAYIAENDVILAAINDQLEKVKGQNVEVRFCTKVKGYNLPDYLSPTSSGSSWAEVLLENGEILRSKLVIGADGINSLLRSSAKIHSVNWDYKQMAVVATLHLSEDTINNVAWQRFLPDGPIALLPLSNEASCLIWTTTPDKAKSLLQLSCESFVDEVNDALWTNKWKNASANYATQVVDSVARFFGLEQPLRQLPPTVINVVDGSRKRFPLGMMHATHYVKPRMVLIGDAAHRIHPLAGQGVNLGFGDASCLTKILAAAVYNGQDLGSLRHLLQFETERQRHAVPLMAGIDGIQRLYSTSFTPLVLLRSLGCQATNSIQPIKEQMIQFATN